MAEPLSEESKAWADGVAAREGGHPQNANPHFHTNATLEKEWADGWNDADIILSVVHHV